MPTKTDTPLTVTESLFDALVVAMDTIFPAAAGTHVDLVNDMLDAEVIDRTAFQTGRHHAHDLAVMGTKPSVEHAPLVGMLAISGFAHTLGFVVQTNESYL